MRSAEFFEYSIYFNTFSLNPVNSVSMSYLAKSDWTSADEVIYMAINGYRK